MKKTILLTFASSKSKLFSGLFRHYLPLLTIASCCIFTSCDNINKQQASETDSTATTMKLVADADNGGIKLMDGFQGLVVADTIGKARHMTIRENGDIYVSLADKKNGGGITALRDTNSDGRADQIERFGDFAGTGISLHNGYLYFAPDSAIFRYRLNENDLVPAGKFETVVSGLVSKGQHASKPITFDGQGNVYVTIGAPSNACQEPDRQPGVKGQDPCPILEYAGGIWQFKADQLNQTQKDGRRYATGIRNAVAIDWNTSNNTLYALQHGRDQLAVFWPKLYTPQESAELPSEEFLMVKDSANFGWPYCFNDHIQKKKILAPEYGGDKTKVGRCEDMDKPIMAFPGHWAPNDVLFYTGSMFPEKYRNGAFIAFHGSWNRAPLKQGGYFVAFVPFAGDKPSSDKWEVFAEGFTAADSIASPGDAKYRPMGLAQGPDGSLFIADSQKGRIWRIIYGANKVAALPKQPAAFANKE